MNELRTTPSEKMFEQLKILAELEKRSIEDIFPEIVRRGIESKLACFPTFAKRRAQKKEKENGRQKLRENFIRENAPAMSDEEIAKRLGICKLYASQLRCRLGIRKKGGVKGLPCKAIPFEPLSEEGKQFIKDHPELSHKALSRALNCEKGEAHSFRKSLLLEYLHANGFKDTDQVLGKMFKLYPDEVARIRNNAGFRKQIEKGGHKKVTLSDIGTKEEVEYALTSGGKTMKDIMEEKNLPISNQRMKQLVGEYGIANVVSARTVLWYCNRTGHPELADRTYAEKLLKEKGCVNALSRYLGTTPDILSTILEKHAIVMQGKKNGCEKITLYCSQCTKPIVMSKARHAFETKNKPNKHFFCDRHCNGKYVAANYCPGSNFREQKKIEEVEKSDVLPNPS